jgi:hypothetical protein
LTQVFKKLFKTMFRFGEFRSLHHSDGVEHMHEYARQLPSHTTLIQLNSSNTVWYSYCMLERERMGENERRREGERERERERESEREKCVWVRERERERGPRLVCVVVASL